MLTVKLLTLDCLQIWDELCKHIDNVMQERSLADNLAFTC